MFLRSTTPLGLQPVSNSLPSSHFSGGLIGAFEPGLEIANAYPVLDLCFFNFHRDHCVAGYRTHSFAGPEDFESLRDRIVEAFRRDADRVLYALGVIEDDFAALDRHPSGDLAVSPFVR
jgi:hypothetical protein